MKIQISGPQMTKFKKGQPFQLSKDQIQGQPKKGKQHEVEIDDAHMKKIQSAAKRGKGYRISGEGLFKSAGKKLGVSKSVGDGIEGGSFLKSVKNTAKKAGKTLKKGVSVAKNTIEQVGYDINLGKNIEATKDFIPESVVKSTIKTALLATGMTPEEADLIASSGTTAVYNYSFDEKASKKNVTGALKEGAKAGLKSAIKSKLDSSATTTGGAMMMNDIYNTGKGNSKLTLDVMKNPIYKKPKVASSGGMLSSQVMMSQSKPVSMVRTKASLVKDTQVKDANNMKGGSFKPNGGSFLPSGGSFKPVGGSMVAMGGSFLPSGGSFKPLGEGLNKPQKGSQEMKDKMSSLRAMRNKNKD